MSMGTRPKTAEHLPCPPLFVGSGFTFEFLVESLHPKIEKPSSGSRASKSPENVKVGPKKAPPMTHHRPKGVTNLHP